MENTYISLCESIQQPSIPNHLSLLWARCPKRVIPPVNTRHAGPIIWILIGPEIWKIFIYPCLQIYEICQMGTMNKNVQYEITSCIKIPQTESNNHTFASHQHERYHPKLYIRKDSTPTPQAYYQRYLTQKDKGQTSVGICHQIDLWKSKLLSGISSKVIPCASVASLDPSSHSSAQM